MEHLHHHKELTIGELFSKAWPLFKQNFKSILLVCLVVYIPLNFLFSFVPLDFFVEKYGEVRGLKLYSKVGGLFEALFGVVALMAIAHLINSKLNGVTVSFEKALQKGIKHWAAACTTTLLMWILLLGLTLLLVVPGLIFYGYWIFAMYAVILHNKSGMSALAYSKSVVQDRWWKVFWYTLVIGVVAFIFNALLGLSFIFLPDDNTIITVITDTIVDIVYSFFIVVNSLFFINFDQTKKSSHDTGLSKESSK